jgi:transcriptional regulator of arginine metabolism
LSTCCARVRANSTGSRGTAGGGGLRRHPGDGGRDLEQVGAVKVKREGKLGYSLPEKLGDRNWPVDRLKRIFAEWVQAVETSGSMVVVRTPPGSAHLVALAVDQAKLPEVVGTIAGDDALFIAFAAPCPPSPSRSACAT